MKRYLIIIAAFLLSCSSNDPEVDTTYPEIDMSISEAFPQACAVLEKGKTYTFKAKFTDNQELGSYSLDIHNNFDNHTHDTGSAETCHTDKEKTPVNPFVLIKDFAIPSGQREYTMLQSINIPENVDAGDYHLTIKLVDQVGWSTLKRISIKIK